MSEAKRRRLVSGSSLGVSTTYLPDMHAHEVVAMLRSLSPPDLLLVV